MKSSNLQISNELAYSYTATAKILHAKGYSMEEIKQFLAQNQNATGYIESSKLPKTIKIS